jgi:hypothetical protein
MPASPTRAAGRFPSATRANGSRALRNQRVQLFLSASRRNQFAKADPALDFAQKKCHTLLSLLRANPLKTNKSVPKEVSHFLSVSHAPDGALFKARAAANQLRNSAKQRIIGRSQNRCSDQIQSKPGDLNGN